MERTRNIAKRFLAAALFLSLLAANAQAQTASRFRCQIYDSYVANNMKTWKQTLAAMEQQYAQTKDDSLLFELVRSYYGYIPFAMAKKNYDEATVMLDKAFSLVDKFIAAHPNNAEALAIKSAFYGFRIGINPIKAPVLGLKSVEFLNKALELAPQNPWVLLEKANALQYKPKMFGGDPEVALSLYQKIVADIKRSGTGSCSWNFLNVQVNLAFSQIKLKKYGDAMKTYRALLAMAPNCRWVENELIPQLQKKMDR